MNRYEIKAIARLRAAQTAAAEYKAEFGHWAAYTQRGSEIELGALARYNELQAAQWPFATGKYAWPAKEVTA